MNKVKAILLGIALFLPIFLAGCDPSQGGISQITVTSVKLEDWTDPKDGQVYLVALPTWKNDGKEAVRQVLFVAELKDAKDFKPVDPKEPQFYGAIVEPGTTVTPQRIPEDGVILGVKKDLEDKYGPIDASKVEVEGLGSPQEYKPEKEGTNA
jgi:hypothetical protein